MGPRGLVLVAAVLFGTTGTARALGPDISPLGVGASRIAVGAALLAVFATVLARRARPGGGGVAAGAAPRSRAAGSGGVPSPGAARLRWPLAVVLAGGIGVAGYQLSFFAAVADTGVAVGTVVALGSAPVFAGLLSRITGGARLDGRWVACTALATAGVALLVASGGGASATVSPLGIGL